MALDPKRRSLLVARLATILSLTCLLWIGCSGGEAPPAEMESPAAEADAAAAGPAEEPDAAAAEVADNEAEAEPPPPGEAPFDTTYLDVNSELFVHAKVAEILDSPLVQTLTGGNLTPLEDLKQEIGMDLREVETITIGVVNVASLGKKSAEAMEQFNPMAGMGPGPGLGAGLGTGGGPGPTMEMNAADPSMMAADTATSTPDAGGASMLSMDAGAATSSGGSSSPASSAEANAASSPAGERVVEVVRAKVPINLEGLEANNVDRVPHGDTAYFRVRQPKTELEGCLYLAEPNVLVVTDEATIKQIIDEGDQRARPTADLGFVKELPHLLVAVASADNATLLKDLASGNKGSKAPGGPQGSSSSESGASDEAYAPPEDEYADYEEEMDNQYESGYPGASGGGYGASQPAMKQLKPDQKLFEDHTQAVALLVDLSQGIKVDVALRCDSTESAGKIQTEIDRNLTQIREQFETAKMALPGVIQQIAQPLVDSLSAQTSESIVSVSTRLPEEKQSMLSMLPMAVAGMMMSGGMQMDPQYESMTSRRELAEQVIDAGQPATNADELPEGLQVKGLATWGESIYGDQAPPPLEIGVVALEGPAAKAIAMGKMELIEARIDGDQQLKWLGTATDASDGNALTGFVPIQRDGMFSSHPDNGVGNGFLLAPPAEATATLQSVVGQFVLQVAGSTEEVLLTNLAQLRGPVDDDRLAAVRMSVDASRVAQGQIEISWNDSPLIGNVELVAADGAPIPTAGTASFSAGGRKTMNISLAGPPPQDLALRVVKHSDLQDVAVPFRFENLALPETQELTEQQRALLVWTRGESPKDHPDLVIEAQGRWRELEPIVVATPVLPTNNRFGAGSLGMSGSDGYADDYGQDPSMEMELSDQYTGTPPGSNPDGYPGAAGSGSGGSQRPAASEDPLRIVIDLIGPLAQAAEAIGGVEVGSVKTDLDTDLTFEGATVVDQEGDPVEDFVDLTGAADGVAETPPGALRIVVNLTPPNQSIGGISQLNGSLKLRTVRERTETILTDLQERVGPPQQNAPMAQKLVTDRELIKFGLKPAVAIGPNQVMMRLVDGKDERISNVSLVDLNGVPITNVNASVREGNGNARGRKVYAFEFPGGVPQKVGMKISVNMGVKDITIPIRLRDMPLPPMPEDAG